MLNSPFTQRSESSGSSDDSDYDTDKTDLSLQDMPELLPHDIEDNNDHDDITVTGERCRLTRPPEYYLANEEALDSSGVVQTEYSKATELALNAMEQQWVEYVLTECLKLTL
jgi:hypothetical protein